MSCVFQNIAQMKNRYPDDAWLEIIGNCDTQLFLGCTDEMTAKFISDRTGETTVGVESTAKEMQSVRLSNYVPSQREVASIGKRKLLTPDEVLRLPREDALVIFRGQKVLKVKKFDYTKHPEAKKLRDCNARNYVPNWRLERERPVVVMDMLDVNDDVSAIPTVKAVKRKPKESPGSTPSPSAPLCETPQKQETPLSTPKPEAPLSKPESVAQANVAAKSESAPVSAPRRKPNLKVDKHGETVIADEPTRPVMPPPAAVPPSKRKPGKRTAEQQIREQLNLTDCEPFGAIDIEDVLSDL